MYIGTAGSSIYHFILVRTYLTLGLGLVVTSLVQPLLWLVRQYAGHIAALALDPTPVVVVSSTELCYCYLRPGEPFGALLGYTL